MKKLIIVLMVSLICMLGLLFWGITRETEMKDNKEIAVTTETDFKTITERDTISEETVVETEDSISITDSHQKGILIAIDPGHQGPNVDMSAQEPNAPGSSVMKTKATGGTSGRYSGIPEYQLNLDISLQLRDALMDDGYDVVLTRTDNNTAISNSERARLANEAGADIAIRIHANGSEDSDVNGALVLVGSEENSYVGHLYHDSYVLGENILTAYCDETGMKNLGVQINDNMTGINWSQIPVIILEMGFMTNQQDDLNMADSDYRSRMVQGIVNGINAYYGYEGLTAEEILKKNSAVEVRELEEQIENMIQLDKPDGAVVSVYVENLEDGSYANLSQGEMKAASLIKLYIAGCVYEQSEKLLQQIDSDEMDRLVKNMLSYSDNDATNTLVQYLGEGDPQQGMKSVNDYCTKHDFEESHMERLMLDFSSGKENYTSVLDSTKFLKKIYRGELSGSDKILNALKQQDRTGKIPAGLPDGIATANKTGELEDAEHDVAIVFTEDGEYTLSVMLGNLKDTASARSFIIRLSSMVYEFETK